MSTHVARQRTHWFMVIACLFTLVFGSFVATQTAPKVQAATTGFSVGDSWKGTCQGLECSTNCKLTGGSTVKCSSVPMTFKIQSIQQKTSFMGVIQWGNTSQVTINGNIGTSLSALNADAQGYLKEAIDKYGATGEYIAWRPSDELSIYDVAVEQSNGELLGLISGLEYDPAQFDLKKNTSLTPPNRLFVFVQGINTSLDSSSLNNGYGYVHDFFDKGTVGDFLKNNGFNGARYLVFSYNPLGFDPSNGKPYPYGCGDTFTHSLGFDASQLSLQIAAAVQNHPNTSVYIVAHSMGTIVAFAYMAALIEKITTANVAPLPNNGSSLKGLIEEDGPLGGITSDKLYSKVVKGFFSSCIGVGNFQSTTTIREMESLFTTAKSTTTRGKTASIVETVLHAGKISNQSVAEDAAAKGVTLLIVGNINDGLWNTSSCGVKPFVSTEFLQNAVHVYSRQFTAGTLTCGVAAVGHFFVLKTPKYAQAVGQSIVDFVQGRVPNTSILKPSPASI